MKMNRPWATSRSHTADSRQRASRSRVATALVAAALAFAPAVPALAAISAITGVDYVYPGMDTYAEPTAEGKGFVDVLAVKGDPDDMVYIELLDEDGRAIASHLPFKLGAVSAEEAQEGVQEATLVAPDSPDEYAGMLSVNIDRLDNTQVYTIRAYADRDQQTALYEGSIKVIFAQFGEESPVALMVRTASADENHGIAAPKQVTVMHGETPVLYERQGDAPIDDAAGREVYAYQLADSAPAQVTGHINYYIVGDATMTPIKQDSYTLEKGTKQAFAVDELIYANGSFYRTLMVGNQVTLGYPGISEASVFAKELSGDFSKHAPYVAKIKYVDSEGNSISPSGMTDSLVVTRPYTYTPPKTVYVVNNGKVEQYNLDAEASAQAAGAKLQDGSLTFELGAAEELQTANLVYNKVGDTTQQTWLVNYVNGNVGTEENGRVIKSFRLTEDDLEDGTFTPDATLTVDGATYVPTQASIDLTKASSTLVNVYYVPEGAEEVPAPYEITIQYVNIADPSTPLRTQSQTVSITADRASAEADITVPAQFTENGTTYVLLPGQLNGGPSEYHLYHSFYAGQQTYKVFFRDINDDLHKDTVITTIRTVYDDVVVTDLGTTTTNNNAGTGNGTGNGQGTQTNATATLGNDGGLTAIGDQEQGGTTLVRDDGTDTGTERIDDESTPLAAPDEAETPDSSQTASAINRSGALAGIAAAAAAGVGIFIYLLRRNKDDKKDEQDQQ